MTESTENLRDEPFEPEVLHSDLVYRGSVWDVRSDRVRYGEGEIVRQYVDHTGAVAIVRSVWFRPTSEFGSKRFTGMPCQMFRNVFRRPPERLPKAPWVWITSGARR